jgi:putative hemolysin
MVAITLEIIFIILLIVANGIFVLSEMAIVSVRKIRLQQRAQAGDQGAQAALELSNAPSRFLSSIQIGITLVGILSGALGGATIAEILATVLRRVPVISLYSEIISIGIVVLAITYLTLVIGELVPKRLALNNPERIAAMIAPSMRTFSKFVSPIAHLISQSTEIILRGLGVRPSSEQPYTEQEIKQLIEQGVQSGVFAPAEHEMVTRVFRLSDRRVSALMTPRREIVWLDRADPIGEIKSKIVASNHSCFPVAQESVDNILGLVQAKDLLTQSLTDQPIDLDAVLRPALFVPEGMPVFEVMERFKETRSNFALVIDEYGGLQGLVTINDISVAIVGDIPLTDEEAIPEIVQRADGSWLVDGRLLTDELKDFLHIDKIPNGEEGDYQTLGGFMMAFLGRVPSVSDSFEWEGFRFEVVDMDGRRVDKVLISSMNKVEEGDIDHPLP